MSSCFCASRLGANCRVVAAGWCGPMCLLTMTLWPRGRQQGGEVSEWVSLRYVRTSDLSVCGLRSAEFFWIHGLTADPGNFVITRFIITQIRLQHSCNLGCRFFWELHPAVCDARRSKTCRPVATHPQCVTRDGMAVGEQSHHYSQLPVRDRKSRKACIFVLLDERSSKYLMDFNRRPCIGGYFWN